VRISGHGLSIDAPDGWEARILRRAGGGPVLHVATFALYEDDGDFGAAATGRMRGDDVFCALLEFVGDDRARAGVGLFEADGRPAPDPAQFRPNQLQVTRPGQYGWQRFYTDEGRLCCVYAVVMPRRRSLAALVSDLSRVLATVRTAAR
jgi:hypothetical protein